MLSVTTTLHGKTILITGTTGFVGKVLLEKILRDVPEIKRIYVLIRGKAEERLQKEIFKSKIFARLKSQREDFDEYVRNKTKAVVGDVLFENVGLSPKDYQALQNEVDFVVHCAATVDFRERLDNAVRKNVLGTLQLFDVAKTFRHLKAFIHVSTAYVNSDRTGYHPEELPPLNFDPEETVQLILQMDVKELERVTPQLIGHYPNTYTYTKAITERLLEKRRGNVPVCYVRPTIVGAAWRDPVPGWIDSVSAIAAVILYTGVGLVRFIQGNKNLVCDIIPVDVVCNVILAAIPAAVPEKISIFHCGTSQVNPVRWRESARWVSTYWRQHNVKRRVDKRPLKFKFYKTRLGFRAQFFLRYEVPAAIYSYFANTVGTSAHRKQAQLLEKVTQRTRIATETFVHFTSTEFIFGVENTERLVKQLTPEDRAKFFFNLQDLDWEKYYRFFCYGMQKYVLQEEVKPPTELLKIDLVNEPKKLNETQAPTWFSRNFPDLAWSYKQYKVNSGIDNFNTLRTPAETKELILKSPKIREMIKKTAEKEGIGMEKVDARAAAVVDRMAHNLKLPVIRALGYFLRKVWRRIYHGIHVEEKGLEALKKCLGNGPVLLVPTHRSYVDFLIVSYIFFEYDLPMPHIAAGEDFLAVMFVNWIFRNSGAFFLRRSFKGDELYTALFTEYVQRLIADWSPVEFFIEGKRSRSGKSLHPKFGLLYIGTEPFLEKKVPDTTIVPISISYERVIEAELFTNELLGEQKTKESLEGLIRASKILKMNFGRINVIFNNPISLKDYSSKMIASATKGTFDPFKNMEDRRHFVRELGYKITYDLNNGLAYTTTALVATVILTYRKGITAQDLVTKVDWLREEVHLHGGSVAFEGTSEDLVSEGLKLLHSLVSKSRNMFVPAVERGTDKPNKSIIVLDFYRNQLIHLFTAEGMIACILSSSALSSKESGITKEELVKDAKFLANLLKLEFVNRPTEHGHEDFAAVADKLADRGLLTYSKDSNPIVTLTSKGEGHLTFLCHLFWPLIDSYWVAAISLFSLQPNLTSKRRPMVQKMAWLADKMHSEQKISFFESCSMEVLSNCLDLYHQWKIIDYKAPKVSQQPAKRGSAAPGDQDLIVSLVATYQQEAALLDLVETINRYRKLPPAFYSNRANLRRAVLADFPVLAKL